MSDSAPDGLDPVRFVRTESPRQQDSPYRGTVPIGWIELVDSLLRSLDQEVPRWVLSHIEQRGVSLAFEWVPPPGSDAASRQNASMIVKTCLSEAERTCQVCGAPAPVVSRPSHATVLCEEHAGLTGGIPAVHFFTDDELNERLRMAAEGADWTNLTQPDFTDATLRAIHLAGLDTPLSHRARGTE